MTRPALYNRSSIKITRGLIFSLCPLSLRMYNLFYYLSLFYLIGYSINVLLIRTIWDDSTFLQGRVYKKVYCSITWLVYQKPSPPNEITTRFLLQLSWWWELQINNAWDPCSVVCSNNLYLRSKYLLTVGFFIKWTVSHKHINLFWKNCFLINADIGG